jgi:hypothetical protein
LVEPRGKSVSLPGHQLDQELSALAVNACVPPLCDLTSEFSTGKRRSTDKAEKGQRKRKSGSGNPITLARRLTRLVRFG